MTLKKNLSGAVGALCAAVLASPVQAAEDVDIAIISFSPYAPWYIVQERGLAADINLNIRIIEDITAKNAALTSGSVPCMMNTLDSLVVARASGVPVKVVAIPDMSFGLDQMTVDNSIQSVEDFPGKTYGADYAFLNHMWMLLTLKANDLPLDSMQHRIMLPQDSAAAFSSGGLDIDVNYVPFSTQSQKRDDSHVLKTSFTDRTWERGLISDALGCNEKWLAEKPEVAKELVRAWFEAVNWWKENPDEGNEIVARGLDWPVADVELTQKGAIMLSFDQNLGAFGVGDGKALCESLPEGTPAPPSDPSGWGELLFGGRPDCESGYLPATWDLFGAVYQEAGVLDSTVPASEGLDSSILEALNADGLSDTLNSNSWIGRVSD